MRDRLAAFTGVVLVLAGCSSEAMAPAYVGVPGAGIKAEIVSLVPEPDGYLFKVNATNLDAVALEYPPLGGCNWDVERLADDKWVTVSHYAATACALDALLLEPGQTYPYSYAIKSAGIPTGTQVRIVTDGHATTPITF